MGKINVPDDADAISSAIDEFLSLGCHLIVTTGGLSVDPDDVTPKGVKKTGAVIINYGSPVFPGAMVLYARRNESIILGLPGVRNHYAKYNHIRSPVASNFRRTKHHERYIFSNGSWRLLQVVRGLQLPELFLRRMLLSG